MSLAFRACMHIREKQEDCMDGNHRQEEQKGRIDSTCMSIVMCIHMRKMLGIHSVFKEILRTISRNEDIATKMPTSASVTLAKI